MITTNLSTLKIHKLTQAQYDRELANGTLDETALYLTPEEIAEHTHDISDVNDLQDTLDNKADSEHEHATSDITNLTELINSIVDDKIANLDVSSSSNYYIGAEEPESGPIIWYDTSAN